MRPLQCAHTAWVEGTLIHLLTSHSRTQSGGHIHSLTHPFTHLQISHTQSGIQTQLTHWPSTLTNRLEGTLTHSLTWHSRTQRRDHTHSNSLSHRDWRARSPTPSLSFTHSLTHSLTHPLTYFRLSIQEKSTSQTHSHSHTLSHKLDLRSLSTFSLSLTH